MAEPFRNLVDALAARGDLLGWTAVHRRSRGEQLFSDRSRIEVRRQVDEDGFSIEVLCASHGDATRCGVAQARLGVGDDPAPAIDFAVQAARGTRNPVYPLPTPAEFPDVPASDPEIQADPSGSVERLHQRLMACSTGEREARLALAEWFVEHEEVHLANSRGIDASQSRTAASFEWIVLAGEGEGRVDSTHDVSRRRLADLKVEDEWRLVARQTADRQRAGSATSYEGPVVLRGTALRDFLLGGTIENLTSARSRFSRLSPWDPGTRFVPGEVLGDPLTIWSTRLLPFGDHAGAFDDEGLPGQRTLLIDENVFRNYAAGQRYAAYLSVPATGAAGDLELPAGTTPRETLLAAPHVEVASWSWFSPDPTSGDFASEIRLGYMVDGGERRPFSGGMLVGNLLQALADVRWSSETGFFGSYQGPDTARFHSLVVSPSREVG